jgi:hypothetical protein
VKKIKQAICKCHKLPAYREEDHKLPFWVCEVTDRACEVEFKKVKRAESTT